MTQAHPPERWWVDSAALKDAPRAVRLSALSVPLTNCSRELTVPGGRHCSHNVMNRKYILWAQGDILQRWGWNPARCCIPAFVLWSRNPSSNVSCCMSSVFPFRVYLARHSWPWPWNKVPGSEGQRQPYKQGQHPQDKGLCAHGSWSSPKGLCPSHNLSGYLAL